MPLLGPFAWVGFCLGCNVGSESEPVEIHLPLHVQAKVCSSTELAGLTTLELSGKILTVTLYALSQSTAVSLRSFNSSLKEML